MAPPPVSTQTPPAPQSDASALQSAEQYPPGNPPQNGVPGVAVQSAGPVQAAPMVPAAGPPATHAPEPLSQRSPGPQSASPWQAGVQDFAPLTSARQR